jgi:hypothetical protein
MIKRRIYYSEMFGRHSEMFGRRSEMLGKHSDEFGKCFDNLYNYINVRKVNY